MDTADTEEIADESLGEGYVGHLPTLLKLNVEPDNEGQLQLACAVYPT